MLSAHRTLAALALSRGKSAPILTTTSHAAPRGRWNILGTSPEIISLSAVSATIGRNRFLKTTPRFVDDEEAPARMPFCQ